MQIHCVTKKNRHLYIQQLDEHFQIRHDIYVKQRKWMDLDRPDGRECDQFDTENAIYLLALEGSRVVGGSRLVPTIYPHLMSDVFPQLAAPNEVPRGEDIIEWTRFFVVPSKRTEGFPCQLGGALECAVLEFCLDAGFTSITVVMEMYWLARWIEMGWNVTPLGAPYEDTSGTIIGVRIDVTESALANTQAIKNISPHILFRQDQHVSRVRNGLTDRMNL